MREFLNVDSATEMPQFWSDEFHVYVLTRQEPITSYTGTRSDEQGEQRYRFDYIEYDKDEWQELITQDLKAKAISQLDQSIEAVKSRKVRESKELLEAYYVDNPMLSTVHSSDGEYYSVTAEKQHRLAAIISFCHQAEELGLEFTPLWNATGQPIEPWTKEELQKLSLQMAEYVYPLVHKQQEYEKQIQTAKTVDEVLSIEIEYRPE